MLNLYDTYIIGGANSAIAVDTISRIIPYIKRLILLYHNNRDLLDNMLRNFNKNELPQIDFISADITNYQELSDKFSDINITTNFAGCYYSTIRSYDHKSLYETDLFVTKDIIDTNLFGAIHFLKLLLKFSRKVQQSNYVLLGSNISKNGLKNGSIYAATKAAVSNLTKSVAQEEGVNNVLINTVSPGPVETNNSSFSPDYKAFRQNYFNDKREKTALHRLAQPKDISELIIFLTSLNNKHITGEEIFITGGEL